MAVDEVLAPLPERRQAEAQELIGMMRAATGEDPVVWAGKIIGFGQYRYRYESGHSGIAPLAAFAPTARHQAIYLASDYQHRYAKLIAQLPVNPEATRGGPRTSKACLYLSRLDSVNTDVLRELIERTVRVARGIDTASHG